MGGKVGRGEAKGGEGGGVGEGQEVVEAQEAGDKEGGGGVVDGLGRADLFDVALAHDDEAVGDGKGFLLVMGDVEGGDADSFEDGAQFDHQFFAQGAVEAAQRFIQHEELGLGGETTSQGDALAFAAAEGEDGAVAIAGEVDEREHRLDALLDLGATVVGGLETKGDILGDGAMREEGKFLKHETKVALVNGETAQIAPMQGDLATVGLFEAGDEAQEGGFATATWPQETDDFAGVDGQVDVVEDGRGGRIGFAEIGNREH